MSNVTPDTVDLLVIGGGINGAGIARDAAGRGLSVVLCEQGDLAGGTSSASSKMIHGGLRYLEHYEFRLVREALAEREVLLDIAPHLVHPLRFVLPHDASLRPAWMIRAGLFLYDRLGGRQRLAGFHLDDGGRALGDYRLHAGLLRQGAQGHDVEQVERQRRRLAEAINHLLPNRFHRLRVFRPAQPLVHGEPEV